MENECSSDDEADQSAVNLSDTISASVVSITAALSSASITTEAPSNPSSANPSGTIFAAPAAPPCSFVPPLPSTQASVAAQDKEQDVWNFCRIETECSKTRDLPPDYTPPQYVPPPSFNSIFRPIAPGSPLAPQSDKGTSGSVISASHTYPALGAPPSVSTTAYSIAGSCSSFMPPAPRRDNQQGTSGSVPSDTHANFPLGDSPPITRPTSDAIFQSSAAASSLKNKHQGTLGTVVSASHMFPSLGDSTPPSVPPPTNPIAGPSGSFKPPAPRHDNQVGPSKLTEVCIKLQKQHWRQVKGILRNAKVHQDKWEAAKASVLRESEARLQDPVKGIKGQIDELLVQIDCHERERDEIKRLVRELSKIPTPEAFFEFYEDHKYPYNEQGTSSTVVSASHTFPSLGDSTPPSVPPPTNPIAGASDSFRPPAPRRDNRVGPSKLSDVCIKLQKQQWRKVKGIIRKAKVHQDHWEAAKASVLRESKSRLQDPVKGIKGEIDELLVLIDCHEKERDELKRLVREWSELPAPGAFLELDQDHGITQDGPVYDEFFDDEAVQKLLQNHNIDEFVVNEPPSSNEEEQKEEGQKQPDSNEK